MLVNNAGALFPKREVVDVWAGSGGEGEREGRQMLVEKTMATNHLGPFLLTSLLMPTLKATGRKEGSPARVIMVSSRLERGKAAYLNAWMRDPILTPSEEKEEKKEEGKEGGGEVEAGCPAYKPFLAYGASKLANLLMVSTVIGDGLSILPSRLPSLVVSLFLHLCVSFSFPPSLPPSSPPPLPGDSPQPATTRLGPPRPRPPPPLLLHAFLSPSLLLPFLPRPAMGPFRRARLCVWLLAWNGAYGPQSLPRSRPPSLPLLSLELLLAPVTL